MRRAFKIETKNIIFKSFYHFIRYGGLLFMPLIYAFSYIFAFYDPFSKTDQLPITLYIAKTNNKDDNNFGQALGRHLSKPNTVEVGELHINLKMNPESIYVDSLDGNKLENKLKDKTKKGFASIYIPDFGDDVFSTQKDINGQNLKHDGLDKIIKNTISGGVFNSTTAAKLMVEIMKYVQWLATHDLDSKHKIHIFNNQQKNYLLGFGVGLAADMVGSSDFIIKTILAAGQDKIYLESLMTSAGITINRDQAIKFIQSTLNDRKWMMQPKLRLESQMGGEYAKYGYGLAPFFICVSMWIGGMVMTFAVHRKIFDFKITAGKRYFAKWIIIALGVITQATLVMISLYFIGFNKLGIEHWGSMYGFTIIISLVFATIIQGIRYCISERSLGLFVIIILLVLQMASAGGLFPLDTQSKFYQVLNKILPMSKGVIIIRELSFDTNWNIVMIQLGYLSLYLLLIPFAVYANKRKTIKIYLSQGQTLPVAMQTKLAKSIEAKLNAKQGGKNA